VTSNHIGIMNKISRIVIFSIFGIMTKAYPFFVQFYHMACFFNYQTLFFLFESKSLYQYRIWWDNINMFWKSKVSSFRNAGIKIIFSFLKHLKLGLKTIPKSRNFPFQRIAFYKISSFKQRILKLFFLFNKVIRNVRF
jgi:hypothetical protein